LKRPGLDGDCRVVEEEEEEESEVDVTGIMDMVHHLKLKHPQRFGEGFCLHLQCGSREVNLLCWTLSKSRHSVGLAA
jgi:hypothetical protein